VAFAEAGEFDTAIDVMDETDETEIEKKKKKKDKGKDE